MKKEIKDIDNKNKIMRVTTVDERWYVFEGKDEETGLPEWIYEPSSTYICSFYHKDEALISWIAKNGDEAELIKKCAGERGSKVHNAIEDLLNGEDVAIDAKYMNPTTKKLEELTVDEYECVMSFKDWYDEMLKDYEVEVLAVEIVVRNEEHGYAGTLDQLLKLTHRETGEEQIILQDIKTSKSIHTTHRMQLSSYLHCPIVIDKKKVKVDKMQILQVGYKYNKYKKYKATEVEDIFDLFLATKQSFDYETKGKTPLQREFPLKLSLGLPKPKTSKQEVHST